MRVSHWVVSAIVVISLNAVAGDESGDFCEIPILKQGVVTQVSVSHMGKTFCGTALINNRYVRMADVSRQTTEGPIQCKSAQECSKRVTFETADGMSYVIEFKGPRWPRLGTV